jgi:hypothetical protein
MQLKLGDRLTDASGEYEIIGRLYTTTAGKDVHVRVQRVDNPDVTMIRSWGAHERVSPVLRNRRCPSAVQRPSTTGDVSPHRFAQGIDRNFSLTHQHVGEGARLRTLLDEPTRSVASLPRPATHLLG